MPQPGLSGTLTRLSGGRCSSRRIVPGGSALAGGFASQVGDSRLWFHDRAERRSSFSRSLIELQPRAAAARPLVRRGGRGG